MVGARLPAPDQTGPGTQSASCTMGIGSFPGVKRSGGASAEEEGRVELYICSLSGPSCSVIG
jgi:hypothetical protein